MNRNHTSIQLLPFSAPAPALPRLLWALLVAALLLGGCAGGPPVRENRSDGAGGSPDGSGDGPTMTESDLPAGESAAVPVEGTSPDGTESAAASSSQSRSVPSRTAPVIPDPIPIDPSGLPLEELFNPYEGLRLRYTIASGTEGEGDGGADTVALASSDTTPSDAPQLILIVQPSRGSRGDISVHHADGEAWLIMEETETLWIAAASGTDDPVAAAIAELAWPRFLPSGSTPYRAVGAGELIVSAVAPAGEEIGPYEIEYAAGARAVLREFSVEPGPLPGGGPALISVDTAATGPVVLQLESAAIFREREVSGVVVSPRGRPLNGVAVAPHPAVGRLAPSRVAVTDTFGRFVLPMRIAPGDPLRLFFGRVEGAGDDRRIANPQVIRGRADSPDFATLIYTGR
jgi:hypothetical protein